MSPRPRKVTDEELFAAVYAVMNRVGPAGLTLAAIAREAGVTAAVIVQRFGSKRGLMRALAGQVAGQAGDLIAGLARRHRSALAALRAYADCLAGMASSPAAFLRNLAYLQMDLSDPVLRRHLARQGRATRAGLSRLVRAAQRAGELSSDARPGQIARTLEAVIGGSLLAWAFYQEGSAVAWVRADVDAVLAPYRRSRGAVGPRT